MGGFYAFLAAALTDLAAAGPVEQIGAAAAVVAAVFGVFFWVWRWIRSREQAYVGEAKALEREARDAEAKIVRLKAENAGLAKHDADTVLKLLERERRDGNRHAETRIAMDYMAHHRRCFGACCEILANHYVALYEDGLDALRQARAAAMGAVAAQPGDRDLGHLLDEIERMERVEAAPAETREEVRAREERDRLRRLLREAPGDVDALRAVGQREFDAGRYRTAIPIWRRAEDALLAEGDVAPDSEPHLAIRLDLGLATLLAGSLREARKLWRRFRRCANGKRPPSSQSL